MPDSPAKLVNQAAGAADIQTLKKLLKQGADLNAVYRGYRPLQNLIQSDAHKAQPEPTQAQLECMDWLLDNGADPTLPAAWPPARAVIVAAFSGHAAFVDKLLRPPDSFASAALGEKRQIAAILKRNPEFAQARDVGGLTALQCAAGSRMKQGTHAVAKLLLDAGADLCARTKSWSHEIDAVYLAANAHNEAVYMLLLQSGADPTAALTPALWNGVEAMAEAALNAGAQVDEAIADGQPLLNNLIRWGAFRQARWLLSKGASPNIADARGWTALHQAASRGNEKILTELLGKGADPALRDNDGCVPRDHARKPGVASLLVRRLTP